MVASAALQEQQDTPHDLENQANDIDEIMRAFADIDKLMEAGNQQFVFLQSQLTEMGFERDSIRALLEQQEKKGTPVVDVD